MIAIVIAHIRSMVYLGGCFFLFSELKRKSIVYNLILRFMKTLDYPNFAASIKAAGINPSDCNAVLSHMNGLLSEESRNSLGLLIISAPDLNRLKKIIKSFANGYFGLGAAPFSLIHAFACIFAQVEKTIAKA